MKSGKRYWWTSCRAGIEMQTRRRDLWAQSKGEGGSNGRNSVDTGTLPCVKQIAGSYSIAQGAQVGALWWPEGWVGGRLNREWIHLYLWLIHVVVQQKLMQHCKEIILQIKINFKILIFFLNVAAGNLNITSVAPILFLLCYSQIYQASAWNTLVTYQEPKLITWSSWSHTRKRLHKGVTTQQKIYHNFQSFHFINEKKSFLWGNFVKLKKLYKKLFQRKCF